jgi:hypothetical protein
VSTAPAVIELQSCVVKSRSLDAVEAAIESSVPARNALSPLGACWRTEVGVLNQVILLWPYEEASHLARVRAAASQVPDWRSPVAEHIVESDTRVFTAAPFSPPLTPRRLGRLYEIRTYVYETHAIPEVIAAWSEIIDERARHSPFVGAWYSQRGELSDWMHIWAYDDAAHRERIREAVGKAGIWPISVVDKRLKREPRAVSLRMQNQLVVPTRFSSLC